MGMEPHSLPKPETARIGGKNVDNHSASRWKARVDKVSQRQGPQTFVPVRAIDEELPEVNHRLILVILISTPLIYSVSYNRFSLIKVLVGHRSRLHEEIRVPAAVEPIAHPLLEFKGGHRIPAPLVFDEPLVHLREQSYMIATGRSNRKRRPHDDALPFLPRSQGRSASSRPGADGFVWCSIKPSLRF